jgi:aminoglycoside/choline kinase family phosphotransferase
VSPLQKGGSDRKFYRVRSGTNSSMIIVRYSGHREENKHYVDIAQFLAASGVNVPRIYLHDPADGLIFMEDLGELDLWHWRDQPWAVRRPLYQSALDQIALLHTSATRRFPGSGIRLENEFAEQLYLWEQNYFFEHCLGKYFSVPGNEVQRLQSLPGLNSAASRLASLPRVLVHRDFQSQNVITVQGNAWLIDFQGMRPGLPEYDLASLLYDPYVSLSPEERIELADYYHSRAEAAGAANSFNDQEILDLCAMQRLMQALGAYGFLGIGKKRTEFLEHIPVAGKSLSVVLGRIEGMQSLGCLLASLCGEAAE